MIRSHLAALTISVMVLSLLAAPAFSEETGTLQPSVQNCLKLSRDFRTEMQNPSDRDLRHARQVARFGHYYCSKRQNYAEGIHQYQRALHMLAPQKFAAAERETVHIYGFRAKLTPKKDCTCCDCVHAMQRYSELSRTAHTASKRVLGIHTRNGLFYSHKRHDYTNCVASFENAIALIKANPAKMTDSRMLAQIQD